MKYVVVLLSVFVFALSLFSCSKDIANVAPASDQKGSMSMSDAFMNMDFKYDFLLSPRPQSAPNRQTSTEIYYGRLASSRDMTIMEKKFPEIKNSLTQWNENNINGQNTQMIQNVSLRYLRRYFLEIDSNDADKEIMFLLNLLIENGSVDIDILADAFQKIKKDLDKKTRKRYYDYIENLYRHQLNYIRKNASKYEELYKNATGNQRKAYLLQGKSMERKSNACRYAQELMGLSFVALD